MYVTFAVYIKIKLVIATMMNEIELVHNLQI